MIKGLDFSTLALNWFILNNWSFLWNVLNKHQHSPVLFSSRCGSEDVPDSSVQRPEVPSSVEIQGKTFNFILTTFHFTHVVFWFQFNVIMRLACSVSFKESTEFYHYEEEQTGICNQSFVFVSPLNWFIFPDVKIQVLFFRIWNVTNLSRLHKCVLSPWLHQSSISPHLSISELKVIIRAKFRLFSYYNQIHRNLCEKNHYG